MRSRQRYSRVSLILPSSIPSRSSSAVDGYQRSSIANSLPGAHSRLIASTAANARPWHISRFVIHGFLEESVQLKTLPQLQTQKARTELPTPFQSHSIQQNSGHLGVIRRRLYFRREQFQLCALALLIEH